MPLNPPNRNYQGVLLPNANSPKYDSRKPLGDREQISYENLGNQILNYIGAFRIPTASSGDSSGFFSKGRIAYNPVNNSIFAVGHAYDRAVGEFSIPTLSLESNANLLPVASTLQPWKTISLGYEVSGLYYENNKLIVNYHKFYDQNDPNNVFVQTTYHVDDASSLATANISGPIETEGRQYAAGWVAKIPASWQSRLGNHEYIGGFTSSTTRAGVHVSSIGPAAFGIDYGALLSDPSSVLPPINSTPYVFYNLGNLPRTPDQPNGDDFLYNRDLSNKVWSHWSEASYGVILPNSDKYMVFGRTGGHISGMDYGQPPYGGSKGHYTIDQNDKGAAYWIYDLADFEAVVQGVKTQHESLPIDNGYVDIPLVGDNPKNKHSIVGGTIDEVNNIIYLAAESVLNDGEIVVAAYSINEAVL